jgi:integration host factor subunit alpha
LDQGINDQMVQNTGALFMSITKAKIVEAIAEQNGYPKHQSSEIVETLLEIIKRTLESGEDVLVSGFGKFCVKEKRKRRGRNPATGEDMMLEPRRVVTFNCSRMLRDRVNGKQH